MKPLHFISDVLYLNLYHVRYSVYIHMLVIVRVCTLHGNFEERKLRSWLRRGDGGEREKVIRMSSFTFCLVCLRPHPTTTWRDTGTAWCQSRPSPPQTANRTACHIQTFVRIIACVRPRFWSTIVTVLTCKHYMTSLQVAIGDTL
jgi:hypothetical protein